VRTDSLIAVLFSGAVLAADSIPSAQAKDHVGETATVCGHVADARYLDSGSRPTFLNFDKPYPQHTFTAFIAGENHAKFGTPEKDYADKNVCVTGKIVDYNGRPEIVLTDPQQIKLQQQ
jgi:micrococcal nuclease